ncbi:unnamed protein product, partial [Prorocentrum cordatum]
PSGPAGCPPHGRRDGGRRAAERILGPHGAGARGHPAGPHVLGRGQVRHLRRLSGARRQVQAAAALLCQERSALAPPGSWARRQRQRLDEALKPDFGDVHGEGRLRTERAQRRPQPLPGRRAERPGDGGPLEGRCEARLRPLPAELPAEQAEGVRRARRRRPPEGGPEAAAAAPAQGPSAAAGGAKSAAAMGLVRLELGEVLVSLRQAPDVRRAEPALVVPEPSAGAGEQPQGSRHGRGRGHDPSADFPGPRAALVIPDREGVHMAQCQCCRRWVRRRSSWPLGGAGRRGRTGLGGLAAPRARVAPRPAAGARLVWQAGGCFYCLQPLGG